MRNEYAANLALQRAAETRAREAAALASFSKPAPIRKPVRGFFRRLFSF